VIYTSHYMEEVEAICQRIAIVDQGRVLAEGSLADILHHPEAQLEIELDRPCRPTSPNATPRLRREISNSGFFPVDRGERRGTPRLLDELAAAGCTLKRLAFGQQNLEQVFMNLTQRSLRD
jgi:ABC-2 type transport system ATP-binding protein